MRTSKSVLRVAADEIQQAFQGVDHFPSYEIITGNFNRCSYYEPDLLSVTTSGLAHVMRLFMKHYANHMPDEEPVNELAKAMQQVSSLICDEERLDDHP